MRQDHRCPECGARLNSLETDGHYCPECGMPLDLDMEMEEGFDEVTGDYDDTEWE
ncbi:MAG: hypothetical protein HYU64_06220 [Armatimonadetes bacterium]|nr:hypothetical protein [Armatimonadota bacterium]